MATSIPDTYTIIGQGELDPGEFFIAVPCFDYDAFQALPAGILYNDREYGLAGWSSDVHAACYKTSKKFGKGIK